MSDITTRLVAAESVGEKHMHSQELEAVARAIYEVLSDERHEWSKLKEIAEQHGYSNAKATRELFLSRARAALLAIREPTEGMLKAMGVDHAKDRYVPIQEQNIIDGYTAAIDHALGRRRE